MPGGGRSSQQVCRSKLLRCSYAKVTVRLGNVAHSSLRIASRVAPKIESNCLLCTQSPVTPGDPAGVAMCLATNCSSARCHAKRSSTARDNWSSESKHSICRPQPLFDRTVSISLQGLVAPATKTTRSVITDSDVGRGSENVAAILWRSASTLEIASRGKSLVTFISGFLGTLRKLRAHESPNRSSIQADGLQRFDPIAQCFPRARVSLQAS